MGVDFSRTLVSPSPSSPEVRKLTTVAYRLFVRAGRGRDGERGRVDSYATTSLSRNVREGFSSLVKRKKEGWGDDVCYVMSCHVMSCHVMSCHAQRREQRVVDKSSLIAFTSTCAVGVRKLQYVTNGKTRQLQH